MAKKTVWDIAVEIAGKDTGATAAIRQVQREMQNVQAAGKNLGKDFKNFASNAGKLALGVVGGITAIGAATLKLAGDFATAGDHAAKTADSLGMSIEGYQRLSYAMSTAGIEASEFDAAIQKMSNTINMGAAGNEAAAKQLADIGLSAQEFANMRPEESFALISDYMQSLNSDAERTRVAITLFGKTAGPKMMNAMRMGSEGLQMMGDEAQSLGIIITEEQARASENYGDALNRMKNAVGGLRNQFIGGAIGPITQAFDHLKDAMVDQMPAIQELGAKFGQWLGDMVQKLPEIIAKIKEFASNVWDNVNKVKDFLGGWENVAKIVAALAIAPTFIAGIKTVISLATFLKTLIVGVTAVTKLFGVSSAAAGVAAAGGGAAGAAGFGAMAAAVWAATWPILAVIAAIAAVIAIVVLVVKNFDKIKEVAQKVWDGIKAIFGKIGEFFSNVFGKAKDIACKAWDGIKGAASKAWEGIKGGASKVGGFLKDNWKSIAIGMVNPMAGGLKMLYDNNEKFRGFVDNTWGKIKDVASKAWEGIKGAASKAWDGMKSAASTAWTGMKNVAGKAWDGIKGAASKAGGFLKNNWKSVAIGMVSPISGGLKMLYDNNEKFRNAVNKCFDVIKNLGGKIWDLMPAGLQNILLKVKDLFMGAVNTVKNICNGIKNFFTGLWSAIKEGPTATIEYLKNAFFDLFNKIKEVAANAWEGIKNIFGTVGGFFKNIWGGVKDTASKTWETTKNIAGNAWDGIKGAASKAWEGMKSGAGAAKDFFTNRWNDIKEAGGQAFSFIDNFSGGALTRIKDNFLNGINNIKEFFTGLWNSIKEGPAATIEFLKNIFFGLFDSIKQKIESFVGFFTEKMEAVKNFFGGIGEGVKNIASNVWGGIKGLLGHAEGGIFTTRHIAEICEKGPEAVVPLNNSPHGFDIWKQAGEIGGYVSRMNNQQTAMASTSGTPPVMKAAAQRMSGGENIINVTFSQNNTFNGSVDNETVNQISAAGKQAADDFEYRVSEALKNITRNQKRVAFA